MTAQTGARTKAGLKIASTWGTATQATTGDQIDGVTVTTNENATALQVPPIGSGDLMVNQTDRGAVAPSLTIDGDLGYDTPQWTAIAQQFGIANGPTDEGSGAYTHSILLNETPNVKYTTVAFQGWSTGAFEYPSCVTTRTALNFPPPRDYIDATIDMLANEQELATAVNTYANLNSVTASDSKRMVWDFADKFRINAQAGGALADGDALSIQSAVLDIQRPQEHPREARAASGNATPVATGDFPLLGTLTITTRTRADATYFTAHQGGTEYKADLVHTGPLIGGAEYYGLTVNLPRVKLIESPPADLTESGDQPVTYVFQIMVAASNPTGMEDVYPHMYVENTNSANLLNP